MAAVSITNMVCASMNPIYNASCDLCFSLNPINKIVVPCSIAMETTNSATKDSSEVLPPLIKFISDEMDDFDIVVDNDHSNKQLEQTGSSFGNSPVVVSHFSS